MRILLIDDEPDILASVKKVLTRLGHDCETFTDAELAVQAYLNEPFDVVITDCKMPRLHGNDVLKEIRTQSPLANVVMMTAYTEVDSAIESLNLGATAYLRKPIDYPKLLDVLASIERKNRDTRKDQKERALLEKELRRTQHLGSLGLMAGGIAHDFNNLLTTILGYSELILIDCADVPAACDHARMIQTASQRARELVRQILAFSRSEETEPVPLQLKPMINETLNLLKPSIPLNIRIERNLLNETGMIEADPAMMTQLLVNLCMNAIHAMEHKESGVLSVHLGNSEPDATVLQRTGMTPGEYVLLQVADTGTGIDESVLPHIFKPFFTTKSPGKGTGLGLHMVQRVVREIHGGIDLTTASGTGTRFDIYIPRLETRARADQHAKDAPVHGHGNLLVVDDQPEVARLLQKILTRLDYSAHLETTSVQALAWMESQQQPIDLCIIDLSMPELNGLQLIESIRKRFPDMPVIIISGSHPPEESDEGFNRIKPWKFIAKPIDISEMADCLHSLLASAPRQP